jgi:PiT family inorganic phosphate transporter
MSEIISQYGMVFLVMACLFGFFMAWGVGANDVANAMGTSVGAGAITIKQAILIAMIFEFAGAYLAGGEVTSTIRSGIIDIEKAGFADSPELLVYGMLSSLLAAGIWLLIASNRGWPVSTTHSIIGAIVGFAVVGISVDAVVWSKIWSIIASWVVSPMVSGFIAFCIFRSVQKLVLDTDDPFTNAKKYVPFYIFLVGFVIAMVTLVKGLRYVGLDLSYNQSIVIAIGIGGILSFVGVFMLRSIKELPAGDKKSHFGSVERVFGVLMLFTACSMAFAHGSNDVANAIGPFAAMWAIYNGTDISTKNDMDADAYWILGMGGIGIAIGLYAYGKRITYAIGTKLCTITPSRGVSIELASALVVIMGSRLKIPLSTTHCQVGATVGVGALENPKTCDGINCRVFAKTALGWIITCLIVGITAGLLSAQGAYAPAIYNYCPSNTTL